MHLLRHYRRLQFPIGVVLVFGYTCFFAFTTLHWPDRLFLLGLMASFSATLPMGRARWSSGDNGTRIPVCIGLAGFLTVVILAITQNPHVLAGWLGTGAGAIAWVIYFLTLIRHATATISKDGRS